LPATNFHSLFSPNHHSPVKRKIEAFEKAAASNAYASPAQVRSTRLANKAMTRDTPSKIPSKYNTPNVHLKPKPSTSSTTTPIHSLIASSQKGISSSSSKLAHIQKQQQSAIKSHSLSREPSAEDLRRANANVLEEKKKKREEKLRLVHQQKELLEKEKREQAEKQMREREEKYRKMMEEKEQELAKKRLERKRLEEMKLANARLLEQARIESERAEEEKRLVDFILMAVPNLQAKKRGSPILHFEFLTKKKKMCRVFARKLSI
jgi:inner centromere protein